MRRSVVWTVFTMGKSVNDKLSAKEKRERIAAGRTAPWSRTIYGEPASKANSRRLVLHGNIPRVIRSDKARSYADDFARQCPTLDPLFEGDLHVELDIYYASRRPDLDESIILDCLQACGIYRNDRQVRSKIVRGFVDKFSPRVNIFISHVESSPEPSD